MPIQLSGKSSIYDDEQSEREAANKQRDLSNYLTFNFIEGEPEREGGETESLRGKSSSTHLKVG